MPKKIKLCILLLLHRGLVRYMLANDLSRLKPTQAILKKFGHDVKRKASMTSTERINDVKDNEPHFSSQLFEEEYLVK